MNNFQAKQLIRLLSQKWDINQDDLIFKIIDKLTKNIDQKSSFYNGFEFSLVSDQRKIRLLHLYFLKELLNPSLKEKLRIKRIESVAKILKFLNTQDYKFSPKLKSIIPIAKNNLWLFQFGLNVNKKGLERVKIYFTSPDGLTLDRKKTLDLIKKLSYILNLKANKLEKIFKDKDFDTVGIDFLPGEKYFLKVYFLISKGLLNLEEIEKNYKPILSALKNIPIKETGMLCRISQDSDITSGKLWFRLETSVVPEKLTLAKEIFGKQLWLKESLKIIEKAKAEISYLGLEDKTLSFYFR